MPPSARPIEGGSCPDPGVLFRRHAPMVRRALRRLGVLEPALDDAVQDVFVVLVRRVDAFDQTRSLANWLWGIARGVASTHRRARRRRDRLHATLPRGVASQERAHEHAGETEQARRILVDFLGTLDDDKCAVFVLSEVEGCTGPEIAARLDVNLNTVYARLRAARRQFDAAIDRHRPLRARAWLAAWWPTVSGAGAGPVWIPATASSAMAAVLILPLALPSGAPAPNLQPSYSWVEPDEVVVLDEGSRDPGDLDKEGGEAASSPAAQEHPTMRIMRIPVATTVVAITLASTTAFAKPTRAGDAWRADDPQSADEAALLDSGEVQREYVFDNDHVEGESLGPDGTILIQPPNIRFGSLLDIRSHFIPELIKLGTDV